MKPELTLSNDQITNFSIDVIKDFEGCPEALIFLKRIYQDQTDNLRKRKKDFIELIDRDKGVWIMNFLHNCITKPYRARFVLNLISENFQVFCTHEFLCRNKDLNLNKVLTYVEKPTKENLQEVLAFKCNIGLHREDIKERIKTLDFDKDEKRFNQLLGESQFLKGILYFLNDIEGNLTRESIKFHKQLAEAFTWKAIQEGFISDKDMHKESIKQQAKLLLEYTELFSLQV